MGYNDYMNKETGYADNFTERIGYGPDTIKIIKNFMDQDELKILHNWSDILYSIDKDSLIYKFKLEQALKEGLKENANFIIEKYKTKIKITAEKLFETNLEYDEFANKGHLDTNHLNLRPPGFATEAHTDNFNQNINYSWTGHLSNLIYINDNYKGGEIYFLHHKLRIKPEPGMFISFPGNFYNKHGVVAADKNRYALSVFLKISDFKII